jgi:hypothetical protein
MIRLPDGWQTTVTLLFACAILAGLLALRWLERPPAATGEGAAVVPRPLAQEEAAAPQVHYSPPALASFDAILARPLFLPDRRPLEPPAPAAAPAAPPPAPLRARLEGVVQMGETRVAVVRDLRTNEGLRLSKGKEFDGWTVERVEPERAVLIRGDGQLQELRLEPLQ